MKKLLAIFIFILCFAFVVHEVRADYASSYQDYVNKTGTYQSAYSNYLTARSNYLASKSIDSQDKAKSATLKMLQARDDVMTSYLNAVKLKVQAVQGMPDADKGTIAGRCDTEISWYNAHKNKLTSAGSLDDLTSDSEEAKQQYENSTIILAYQAIVSLGVANNSYVRGELSSELTTLKAKIDEIKANQDKDVSSIERSLIDVENKLSRSQTKDSDAQNLINGIKPADQQKDNDFQDAQTDLLNSNAYLKEANQQLLQIITQIKSAN